MPTIESLKAFLVDQHRQGFLPTDPSFLFSADFLQHLLDFMDGNGADPEDEVPFHRERTLPGQRSCKRCDAVMDGLSRQMEVMQLWQRFLQGGDAR
jgi:hypothetical protein